ncbi:MAG TPA: peptidylprolyl isomerase [Pseudoflavonifractor sp.]|nr:peptidylprolyl isomerase [Pseudoflavonifractor sp.]
MSASREKKERQGTVSQGLTQKQLKEAKEAQAAKQKAIAYWIGGIVVTVLVVALLVWNSGFFQSRATAATVGSENLSMGEMQYYYSSVRNQELYTQQLYSQWGITTVTAPNVAYDSSSAEGDKQIYNTETNETYAEHFRESALNAAKQDLALINAAKEAGYTLSADGRTSMQDSLKDLKSQLKTKGWSSLGAYLKQAYGKYVTEGIYNTCVERSTLASEYSSYKQDSLTYTTSQLEGYEKENPALLQSYDFRYAYISGTPETKTDADGKTIEPTDEEKAAAAELAKSKADALVNGVEAAEIDKRSDAFNELVVDAVGDTSSYADPDNNLQSNILGSDLSSAAYFSWLSDTARKAGDIAAVPYSDGYYVLLFLNAGLNDTATVDVRHILIKAEAPVDDEATADVDESKNAPSQEALDAAKTKAQALLDEFNALPDDKRTAEAFGKLANENSEDTGSNTKGGLYRYVSEGEMVPEFDAWIFDSARQSGDTGLVANVAEGSSYYGYHVMYFVGQDGPKWHEKAEEALKEKDMTAWSDSILEPYTAAWTDAGIGAVGN